MYEYMQYRVEILYKRYSKESNDLYLSLFVKL